MWKSPKKYIEFSDTTTTLNISLVVVKTFKNHEQKAGQHESGGILLGYTSKKGDYICKATIPNKYDLKGAIFFIRARGPAQKKINRVWKISKGTMIYLGEWHTHFENDPKPSRTDINMIKQALKNTEMEIDFLYLIIVGLNGNYWVGRCTVNGVKRIEPT